MNDECKKSSNEKARMRNCNEELLGELYKNVDMGKQALLNVIPKVKNADLSAELTSQLSKYGGFSEEITALLNKCGGECRSEGMLSKMSSKIGIEMNTLTDSSDAHIAQMVIEGTTMCITDTIRLVRDYENSNCSEQALDVARKLVSYQEKAVEKIKKYL